MVPARLDQGLPRAALRLSLKARPLVLLIGLAVAGSSYFIFNLLKSELAPYEDQGTVVSIFLAPEGSTIDYTDKYAKQLETIFSKTKDVERYFVVSGNPVVSQGIGFVKATPWSERTRSQQAIAEELRPKLFAIPGIMAFPGNPPPLGQSVRDKPIGFVIQTTLPYDKLQELVDAMMEKARANPGFTNLDTDLKLNTPQLNISVDREKAADLGIQVETLGRTLETLLGGRQVTRFKREGEQYDVIVQVANIDRRNPEDLRRIYVRGSRDEVVPLANLIQVRETVAPKELNHFNQLRSATISAHLVPGYTVGEGLAFSTRPPTKC